MKSVTACVTRSRNSLHSVRTFCEILRHSDCLNQPHSPGALPCLSGVDSNGGGDVQKPGHRCSIPSAVNFFVRDLRCAAEVGENIQKVFAYGLRNTFGMDFDPASGELWLE
jgi:hypothetical protein